MLRRSSLALFLILGLATACDDSSSEDAGAGDADRPDVRRDAGPDASRDASPTDTGRSDAVVDLGFQDAEAIDAAVDAAPDANEDAAAPDADEPDAEPDAEVDAGEPDLGEPDSGEPDAGEVDAGPLVCPTTCQVTTPNENIPTTGRVLWLRADRGVNVGEGDAVCLWCDLSGNNHDMPATGVPVRLGSAAGGQPAVQCGTGNFVSRGDLVAIPATAGRTFITVYRMRTTTARTQPIGQGQGGTAGTYVMIDANTFLSPAGRFGVYVTNNAYYANTLTSTQPAVHTMRMDSMQPGLPILSELEYFIDGAAQTLTRTSGGLGNTNIESFAGANYTAVGATGAPHEISEVLVYDRPLTEPERAQVEAYLMTRYGL